MAAIIVTVLNGASSRELCVLIHVETPAKMVNTFVSYVKQYEQTRLRSMCCVCAQYLSCTCALNVAYTSCIANCVNVDAKPKVWSGTLF